MKARTSCQFLFPARSHVRGAADRADEKPAVLRAGKRDQLAGMIQESYGITREATEEQVAEWEKRQKDVSPPR